MAKMKVFKKVSMAMIFACNSWLCLAQISYPETPKIPVYDTLWGEIYRDDYRWLENMKDSKVNAWFTDQASLADSILSTISGREELIDEWRNLDLLQPDTYFGQVEAGGRIFLQKRKTGDKISKVYYREANNNEDILLFDPLAHIPGEKLTVESITPSYDGKKLLVAYSKNGAEVSTLRIIEVDTKRFLPDVITDVSAAWDWSYDNSHIMYMWIKSADNADPTARLNPKTKLHKIGSPVEEDIDFFSNESYPDLGIKPIVYPYAFLSLDAKDYIFAGLFTVESEYHLFYAPIDQYYSGAIKWTKLCSPEDKLVKNFEFFDNRMYAITSKDAQNYQLVSTSLFDPNWETARVDVPETDRVLENIITSKDFILLQYSDGINNYLHKYNPRSRQAVSVALPLQGTFTFKCIDKKLNDCLIEITSWNKPFTEFLYDAEADHFEKSPYNTLPVYPDKYKNLIVEEVEVEAHDGAMIPMSIIYQKGFIKDGSNICLMEGYGAYGITISPYFSKGYNSLAVRNVVVAIPHVRGGGVNGEDWYRAGFKTTKPNTWKDFISCAEYLIDQKYTSAKRIAGTGTSAGGILISRSITERPDLFGGAICNVGIGNAMRAEFSSNGPANIPEFGTTSDSIECLALHEMDGMQHVKSGIEYPAMMSVVGWNDPRVVAWQPAKFAAAVQNSSTSGKPVLIKVNYDNGHFTEDRDVTWANFAEQYAFLMWQCGHPDFKSW